MLLGYVLSNYIVKKPNTSAVYSSTCTCSSYRLILGYVMCNSSTCTCSSGRLVMGMYCTSSRLLVVLL